MDKKFIRDLIFNLFDEKMIILEDDEDNKDFRKYLEMEYDFLNMIKEYLPEQKVNELSNLYHEVTSNLSYVLFLEGMKAINDLKTAINNLDNISLNL